MMPVIRTKVRQLIDEKSAELGRPLKLYEVSVGSGLQQSILRKYINNTIVNLNKPTLIKLMAYFNKKSISDILVFEDDRNEKPS